MKQPKITVIMPVYNCELWVDHALNSIPVAGDVQVVVVNDGSTDNSWTRILTWYDNNYNKISPSSEIINWQENKGVASALNLGYSRAIGEYVVLLSADDWFIKDFEQFRPLLNGENDLVYFDLEVNDGSVWHVTPENEKLYVGSVKFMRRGLIGDTRVPDKKWHEDVGFTKELMTKNPKKVFTGIVLKHYNFPREGSLTWQATHKDAQ